MNRYFKFKRFTVFQGDTGHKVGTDSVLLGAWADCSGARRILDIGTGTGILALMMAQRYPDSEIFAIDIDPQVLEYAKLNFANSPWAGRIVAVQGDFRRYEFDRKFDCIVVNPPYFHNALKPDRQDRLIARHNETLSFEDLARKIKQITLPEAKINVVVSAASAGLLQNSFEYEYLFCNRRTEVFTSENKPARLVLFKFLTKITQCIRDNLYLRRGNRYTDEYRQLTSDFYLFF